MFERIENYLNRKNTELDEKLTDYNKLVADREEARMLYEAACKAVENFGDPANVIAEKQELAELLADLDRAHAVQEAEVPQEPAYLG